MLQILETDAYATWFEKLRDRKCRDIILARLRRVELGNFGDSEPVGEGVSEMRIHVGPGYRIYILRQGIVVSSCWPGAINQRNSGTLRTHWIWRVN